VQVLDFIPHVLSLQLVLDADGRIHFAQAGRSSPVKNRPSAKCNNSIAFLCKTSRCCLASAGGFPGDVNLIQSHKAIHHAYRAVRPGGILVVYAECAEGIGSSTFMPYFSHDSSAAIVEALLSDYQLNGHTALSLKRKTETVRLFLVSSLPAEQVRRIGMIPLKPTDSLWQEGVFQSPANGLNFPQAAYYLPICENRTLVT
jgi:nickel-dependent lactate racemase